MKLIGIIGAGISGLATAKAFREQGYDVLILEKAGALGGVWCKSRFYVGVATQTTKNEYAFSDFPMPADYPEWPSGTQVNAYMENYAAHFDILKDVQFFTEVLDMRYEEDKWTVHTRHTQEDIFQSYTFDFVAVCTGTFHEKYIPAYPGMQSYLKAGGQVLHSSEIKDDSLLANKHVAVVGFAKSATDIVTRAADKSLSSTLLYRKAQWKVPRFFAHKINLKYLLFSRFSEAFFVPYRKTKFQHLLHSIGKPLVWMQWRGIEALLKAQFKLKQCNMLPAHRIEDQISCSLGIAPEGFYEKVRSKKINAIHAEIKAMDGKNIMLTTGETISPDVLIFGTGFRQSLNFLPGEYQQLLRSSTGAFALYRNIINPKVPKLGFVGFNSSLFSTLTSEVAANWLAHYVSGKMTLPSQQVIEEEIARVAQWRKMTRPIASEFSGSCVAPFNFQHLDELMRDMGYRTRASNNPIYEFFKPISPADYQKLLRRPMLPLRAAEPAPAFV
jgi:cation diffusion facilitator CzcD-associated flavoprotein CzcO